MIPWLALLFAGVAFFSTMAGGFAALRWPGRVQALAALAGGVVLGAAFFDLLPEASDRASELKLTAQLPVGAGLGGVLGFYTLERFLHHHDEEDEGPSRAGPIGAAGFIVHSVFDGLAIGLGFRIDTALGLLVAAAVIGHDLSDGLNTVSYLITHRQPTSRSPAQRSRRWYRCRRSCFRSRSGFSRACSSTPRRRRCCRARRIWPLQPRCR